MGIYKKHFPLGLGTTRFPVLGPKDTSGIEKSIELVSRALERGITYADVGFHYSAGMAPMILKEAFQKTGKFFSVTAKVLVVVFALYSS